jgi:hypothetical protein
MLSMVRSGKVRLDELPVLLHGLQVGAEQPIVEGEPEPAPAASDVSGDLNKKCKSLF